MILTLGVLSAMAPLATDMHLPGLPEIAESFGTSDAAAAATITVAFGGFAIGQLALGGVGDRFGRRRPALVCIALFALVGALCAIAPTIEALILARFFQGFFGAGGVISARAAVRDMAVGSAAAGLYSQLAMVTMLAPVLAPLLGGQVLRFTSWRGLFWTFTGICVVMFAWTALLLKETLPAERRQTETGQVRLMWRVVRHPGFSQHLVLSLCQGAILFSYLSLSSLFLRDEYGMSVQGYSYLFATLGLAVMLGHFVNMRVAPRWGALNMLTTSVLSYFIGCAALMSAVLLHAPLFVLAGALFLTMFAIGPSIANNMALAMVPFGVAAGTASSLVGATQQLGGATFPTLAVHLGNPGMVMATTMLIAASVGVIQVLVVMRPALSQEPHAFTAGSSPLTCLDHDAAPRRLGDAH